jgi:hypothetical protein
MVVLGDLAAALGTILDRLAQEIRLRLPQAKGIMVVRGPTPAVTGWAAAAAVQVLLATTPILLLLERAARELRLLFLGLP